MLGLIGRWRDVTIFETRFVIGIPGQPQVIVDAVIRETLSGKLRVLFMQTTKKLLSRRLERKLDKDCY